MKRTDRGAIATLIAAQVAAGLLFLSPGWIRPDSVATYSYLRSALVDGDFVFFNEWAAFGMIRDGVTWFSEVTPTGALANHWWTGTSQLSAPFYLAAHVIVKGNGFEGAYAWTLAWSSVAFVVVAMIIAVRWLRRLTTLSDAHIVFVLLCISVGTPLFWYTFRFPLGTHAAGTLSIALLLAALLRGVVRASGASSGGGAPEARTTREWQDGAAAGLALGLAIATRLQHFVLVPAFVYGALAQRRSSKFWLGAFAGALLPLLVQGIAWWSIYGTPLGPLTRGANLGGTTWMPFQNIALITVLTSSFHGLFSWCPLTLFAMFGWLHASRSADRRRRVAAMTITLMFLGEWIANGTFDRYFWGGMSFGPRRFVDLAVPFAIGLAWFIGAIGRAGIVIAVLCSAWTAALAAAAASGTLSLSRYVSGSELLSAAISLPQLGVHFANAKSLAALAGVVVIAVVCVFLFRNTTIAIGYAMLCVAFAAIFAWRTPSRAAAEAARLHVNVQASSRLGALYDQRQLLTDEIAWARARGDTERATKTEREIAAIDALITERRRPGG